MSRRFSIAVLLLLSLCALSAFGQEARGGITGVVTDPQGSVIPGATVTITNTSTNETRRMTTNTTGYYEVNFLEPASYTVAVEFTGFKRSVRSGLDVNVGTKLEINIQLEVGGVAEVVEVTGQAPLLETTTASGGRVLDQRQLINLPFSDLNPFALSALAPGMQWTGQPEYRRPFDNGGTSAFNTSGGVGQNEYTMDGMTVTGTGRRVGFTPPADSITEFKLETSNFDASQGFTSGAAINVVSRSGGNALHGSVFNQHWQQRWNATPFFRREQYDAAVRAGTLDPNKEQKQATGRSNNYGISASGPVWIPKVFNGKDKLFWTFTWNGIRQSKAETTSSVNVTVPSEAVRQGDFSYFLGVPNGANRFTIHDPRSARLEGANVFRTPFPGNKIPFSALNPAYASFLKLFPTPNNVPGLVSPELTNNYLAFSMPKDEKFNSLVNRFDWVAGQNHRVNFRWQWNDRLADEYDWTYETVRGLHSNGLTRINRGGNVGYLWTINASNVLDTNFGISRFEEGSRNTTRTQYKAADFGLPAYIDQRAGDYTQLPRLDFDTNTDVGGSYPIVSDKMTAAELRAGMTTIKGSHTFKYGWQERRNFYALSSPGSSTGIYQFRNNWTRASNVDNVAAQHVHEWAAFLLGLPSGISIDTNDSAYYRTPRRAFYFQDDWRVTSKLRLSLGLRYEREDGSSERYNRGIAWDFIDEKNVLTDLVQSAYASSPIAELPASQLKVTGLSSYLGDRYSTGTSGVHNLLPKVGGVFSINNKTVIRGGWGMYADTFNVSNDRPYTQGFTQPTGTPVSNDSGYTFCCGVGSAANLASGRTPMNDPFPVRPTIGNTRFDEPYKNALGDIALFGGDFESRPWEYKPALQNRWRIGVQREIMNNLMIDVSYNGAYAFLPLQRRLNYLPEQYWTTGMARNQANDNFLNQNVANPFNIKNLGAIAQSNPVLYRYMSGNGFFTGANIARNRLLRGYPQYNNLRGYALPGQDVRNGWNRYHDMQVQVERRFTKGFQTSFMYTTAVGYTTDHRDTFLNEFDLTPTERINNGVLPHRIAWSAVYETPFGKGRTYLKDGPLAWVVGNWNLSWVYQWQSGPATDWGNRFFYGNLDQLESIFRSSETRKNDLLQWFDPSIAYRGTGAVPSGFVGFEGRSANQPGSYHVRMFPQRIGELRADGISNLDLKVERLFPIMPERGFQARFSVDMLNATNHTNFSGPNTDPTNANFGRVTSQRGLSRVIQFNLRVEF